MSSPSGLSSHSGPLHGLTVLVVDPDADYAHALGRHLSVEGATVTYAESGLIPPFSSAVPRVVITELMLPGQSGLDLLTALRSRPSPPPVIVVTANHAARLKAYSQSLGAAEYFVKPADFSALSQAILAATGHE